MERSGEQGQDAPAGSSDFNATPCLGKYSSGFYAIGAHGTQGTFYAHTGSLFVARSYIQGAVDIVYGRTCNAWFQGVKLGATGLKGTLTAQGRQTLTDDGYFVFDKAYICETQE